MLPFSILSPTPSSPIFTMAYSKKAKIPIISSRFYLFNLKDKCLAPKKLKKACIFREYGYTVVVVPAGGLLLSTRVYCKAGFFVSFDDTMEEILQNLREQGMIIDETERASWFFAVSHY